MATIEDYFDEIDSSRIHRIRELSELKRIFSTTTETDPLGVGSKALVVLTYAAWEGFYNDCVETYCRFLVDIGKKVKDAGWNMLVGSLSREFESLRARNHSPVAQREFVESLKTRLSSDFADFDKSVVKARSNLDFKKLDQNFRILAFDISPILRHQNRIDKELVGWRHSVAHGDSPTLVVIDATRHISLVEEVMALIADTFQEAILRHA